MGSASVRFDEHQRRAIESGDRTLRIVAAAGSGKTETIVERIARRISRGLDPGRALVLTFDTSAARSLRERLAARLREGGGRLPRVATLNAYGLRLLRQHVPEECRRLASGTEREALLEDVVDALGRKSASHRNALARGTAGRPPGELVSLLKNALFDPRTLDPGDTRTAADPILAPRALSLFLLRSPPAAPFLPATRDRRLLARSIQAHLWVFAAYERTMRRRGWMDFDDQKLRAWAALVGSVGLRRRVQERYREIVVDEFQDINRLDFELVRILSARATLILAGDDDQAIYGFRGCTPDYILDPAAHLGRRVVSCELRTNYRNAPNLLERAERLIAHNRRRIPKRPAPFRRDAADIRVRAFPTAESQAAGVVAEIVGRGTTGDRPGSGGAAVLYRTHAQSLPVRRALVAAAIPHVVHEPESDTAGGSASALDARPPRSGGGPAGVELLTYFKAKGLQWDSVFLIDCNAGTVPHPGSPVEDERRLFYVALTRAHRRLWIGYRSVSRGGPAPSPFLYEAGLVP